MTPEQLDEIEKLAEAWHRTGLTKYAEEVVADTALPLVKAVREAWAALDEREGDMHDRIRAGYDKTVADIWREHCARIEKERDAARNYAENRNDEANKLQRFLNRAAQERDEARAEVERLNKRLESEQHFIDSVCHYRNLAIVLGAKPEQMLGKFDRELCESGIDPNDTSGGYHVSVNQQLAELKDVWAEVERLRSALRLLWEEAQDDCRCHHHGHMISQLCRDAVEAALKEGDR